MRMPIPLRCPECSGSMYSVSYDPALPVLKHREWQYCRECGFVRDTEEFKRSLLTV